MKKKLNIDDILAKLCLVFLGLLVIVTGMFLIISGDYVTYSGTYFYMSKILSLDAWGVILSLSGVLVLVSIFQNGSIKLLSMLIGGGLSGLMFLIYATASIEGSVSLLAGIRYVIIACVAIVVSYLGGVELWKRRTKKEDI
ncbi:hypothetical protein [Lederbergia lenta]|uniref:hypothetical protein n=1 Tax=Lederbergia lenta TaxID=1467 RepID=UPI00203FDEEB|nr:hypothetical protein [Lederbergia lenta]MCM3110055.1 hypothetical protein [Lederbergia lenta]